MAFKLKRVYEAAASTDGRRVLIDRLWPRGLKKAQASVDDWMKEVAPSSELRTWFAHDAEKFGEFAKRYRRELNGNAAVKTLRGLGRGQIVTLLYAAHDPKVNHAVVLKAALDGKPVPRTRATPTRPRSAR
jgi:uncharacterized protein YeaO (DUF488 family)